MTDQSNKKLDAEKKLQRLWRWTLGFIVLGFLDSLWILGLHYSYEALAPACGVNDVINCDVLEVEQYSMLLGIPVAYFSLLFYGFGFVLALWGKRQPKEVQFRPVLYLWFMSWMAIASTVYMAIVSIGILKTLCIYCCVLYVVSVGLLIVTWKAKHLLDQPWWHLLMYDLKHAHKSHWFWKTFISVFLLLALAYIVAPRLENRGPTMENQRHEIGSVQERTLGEADAPVAITVFSDFECPFCKTASEMLEALEHELKGKVKITYKFFPLDDACNRIMQRPMHREACRAARASYCAGRQNRFWIYHDLVYGNHRVLSEAKFFDFAREIHLDIQEFSQCLTSGESLRVVQDDIEEAIALGLQGTPSVFIDGRKYTGSWTISALTEAVNQ